MNKDSLVEFLTHYLTENPSTDETEILHCLREARKQAILNSLPSYRPLSISDKKEISTDFEEQQKKVSRIRYRDESTREFD